MQRYTGQRAVVTGANGGLGRAVVGRLRAEGAEVVGLDLQGDGCVAVDVADGVALAARLREALAAGPIHALVTCAGTIVKRGFEHTSPDDWQRVMAVNAAGTFFALQAVLPAMRAQRYGRVVTIGSIAADFGYTFPAYGASKAAVIALTRSAAVQYAEHGVTVNCISPGRIDTALAPGGTLDELRERIPAGRASTPDEIAAAVAFVASAEAGYLNGANIVCDGAMSGVFALHGLGPYAAIAGTDGQS
jgi:NAD(P)-dependent dehydrogenase (short-subunit alcohol dehydrogenase family)